MKEKRKYDRDEIRKKVRNMFLNMGIEVPDIKGMKVIVHGDHGEIVKEYWLGEKSEEKSDVER